MVKFNEVVEKEVETKAIQITDVMGASLLTDAGKKGTITKDDLTAEQLAQTEATYSMLVAILVKKADEKSTVTEADVKAEIDAKLEALAPAE